MPRKNYEAVPEGNCPIPRQEEFGSGKPTMADIYRLCEERFAGMDSYSDGCNRKLDEISDETRVMDEHVTSLEHGARQPRLAMEADRHANTKTQERTEGAAIAVQAMLGQSCTAEQKIQGGPKTSITFGVEAEPPDLPCREDVLVEDGAQVVSPIFGDALTNSRRWLSSHRRSLHRHGDHLQQATSSVLRDRGDESRGGLEDGKFMDFNSKRLVRQQHLLETACCSLLREGC